MRLRHTQPKHFYSGRVIDGPFEGHWVEEDEPFFQGTFTRRLEVVSGEVPSQASIEVDRCHYRWLLGYRAWAWVQPTRRGA
jgi:hypothetical protein